MGMYAAHCMGLGGVDELGGGFNFDIFAHATRFFGKKVIFLGLFNGQHLGDACEDVIKRCVVTAEGLASISNCHSASQRKPPAISDEQHAGGGAPSATGHYEIFVRVTPGEEYIKVVVEDGKVRGALLVGETDLSETFENLILTGLDVGHLGSKLLDPEFDLEDYFD